MIRHMNTERIDTRQHILACGQQLVAGKGFVGVGLSEILTSAGVPKGSFYHYFPSKEMFGIALLETYFESYLLTLDALLGRTDMPAGQRLMAYFQCWIDTQTGDDSVRKCLIVKLGAEISDLSEAMRSTMLQGTERIMQGLADCIAAGQADGSIRNTQSPAACAEWLYETWLGASLISKLRRNGSALEAALQSTRQVLMLT
jgi:TetR/AcrR family transcriptional repressor of nem operon